MVYFNIVVMVLGLKVVYAVGTVVDLLSISLCAMWIPRGEVQQHSQGVTTLQSIDWRYGILSPTNESIKLTEEEDFSLNETSKRKVIDMQMLMYRKSNIYSYTIAVNTCK